MKKIILSIFVFFAMLAEVQADPISIEVDPGAIGSSFSFQNFDFNHLAGSVLNGQTMSLDITFAGKFLVGSSMDIELYLNESGSVGTWPTNGFQISGYLMDSNRNAISTLSFFQNVLMPGQAWPGWPFTLPNGSPFLPPTVGYGAHAAGTIIGSNPRDFFIDPLLAYGLHLDIRYPESPSTTLIGSRLQLSSYSSSPGFVDFTSPLYVSPDPVPTFHVVQETASVTLLSFGLIGLMYFKRRHI